MVCHNCKLDCKKFGFYRGFPRFRCRTCGKTYSDIPSRPLDDLRVSQDAAERVIHLLVEGVGIRACERLTGINRNTVLNILEVAGRKCARLLDIEVRGLKPNLVQVDELWSYVACHQRFCKGEDQLRGDQYTYLGIDRETKLIISYLIGKRDDHNTRTFVNDLQSRIVGSYQLTTDGFRPYFHAVSEAYHENPIDFAQLVKLYGKPLYGPQIQSAERRYSPDMCVGTRKQIRTGNPDRNHICTSHVERLNLNVRIFNRRFTRLTLGYSKILANLKHSVALFIAHSNFCRVHGTLGETPAQATGLTDRKWSIRDLLEYDCKLQQQ